MSNTNKWSLTSEEKSKYMADFVSNLTVLRAKAGISQEELSMLIGVSRQTYGAIERGLREMSWNTFLSLLLFFDYNQSTHHMLHATCAFPEELKKKMNNGVDIKKSSLNDIFDEDQMSILASLDEQALRSIRTMIMVEYARCTSTPGEVVVKAFDGMNFNLQPKNEQAELALQMIRQRKKNNND